MYRIKPISKSYVDNFMNFIIDVCHERNFEIMRSIQLKKFKSRSKVVEVMSLRRQRVQ